MQLTITSTTDSRHIGTSVECEPLVDTELQIGDFSFEVTQWSLDGEEYVARGPNYTVKLA